jgi:hypothetical protein
MRKYVKIVPEENWCEEVEKKEDVQINLKGCRI